MQEVVDRLVGKGPLPNFNRIVGMYGNSRMLVAIPHFNVDLPSGQHAHASYEFLIPSMTMAFGIIENEGFVGAKDCIVPINPGQFHGASRLQPGVHFISLAVDNRLMDEVTQQVFGKQRVFFDNENTKIDFNLRMLIRLFVNEAQNKQSGYRFVLDHLSQQITIYLLRTIKNDIQSTVVKTGQPVPNARKDIDKAIDFLHENYNRDFSLNDLAEVSSFSLYHFARIFKKETGKTPYRYFLEIKIEKAKQLLESGKTTVTETGYRCGFSSSSHFSRVFRRMVGMCPSEYCRTFSDKDVSG